MDLDQVREGSAANISAPEANLAWKPERPRLRPLHLAVSWVLTAVALYVAAWVIPGIAIQGFRGALTAVVVIAILNSFLPPLVAALRLPFMLVLGFLLVLLLDAAMLVATSSLFPEDIQIDSLGWAVLTALVVSAISLMLEVIVGTNDDSEYTFKVIRRIARKQGGQTVTDEPGIVYLEIDGLALPVLQRAMRDGNAPGMANLVASGTHRLVEWETDLSSQTGASQAGILMGSNDDIPAFRWVEKETGTMMTCSAPSDCEEIERRHLSGDGLLTGGGASRGNLLSGEADEMILTISRIAAEKKANPGYRSFFANGYNVTRELVLFFWEVLLEWIAAIRAKRRDVRPRGHRGGVYPFMRGALCVIVRDVVIYSVLSDMIKGRPAIYATLPSYDEVAHHSGLERADTLEALRKLDQQISRVERARRFAPRPYEIVVLSDHGQTQGATFKQRNDYGLDDLVRRSLEDGAVAGMAAGDENFVAVGHAFNEASGRTAKQKRAKNDVGDQEVMVLGSGNLGLVYLMEKNRRLTLEEIEARHPRLLPALRDHRHIGFLMVRSEKDGPVVLGAKGGIHYLADGRIEGKDPLASFPATASQHLLRSDGFAHVADIMVNSFYDHGLDEGCAFEELISFHGGMGGSQTRPFHTLPGKPAPAAGADRGRSSGSPAVKGMEGPAAGGRRGRRWGNAGWRRRSGFHRHGVPVLGIAASASSGRSAARWRLRSPRQIPRG